MTSLWPVVVHSQRYLRKGESPSVDAWGIRMGREPRQASRRHMSHGSIWQNVAGEVRGTFYTRS